VVVKVLKDDEAVGILVRSHSSAEDSRNDDDDDDRGESAPTTRGV